MLLNCLFVGIGGFIGSVSRYLISSIPVKPAGGFPIWTLLINISGAFFIGVIIALSAGCMNLNPRYALFIRAGICGGFTTFSTFSAEALQLFQSGKYATGSAYILLSVILGIAAVFAGSALVRNV